MTTRSAYERKIISLSIQGRDFDLGRHLNTSKSNFFGCPSCTGSTKMGQHTIDVFEFGVRFQCGCVVGLPPMHDGRGSECRVCNPPDRAPTDWVDLDRMLKVVA